MAADYGSVAREHQALLDIRALALLRSRIVMRGSIDHWKGLESHERASHWHASHVGSSTPQNFTSVALACASCARA
jgi:hypothetical protein